MAALTRTSLALSCRDASSGSTDRGGHLQEGTIRGREGGSQASLCGGDLSLVRAGEAKPARGHNIRRQFGGVLGLQHRLAPAGQQLLPWEHGGRWRHWCPPWK